MKQAYFIKFNPKIKRLTGCDRATLILEKIEFWFSKQPDGFYKFIEPCSHRLYKKDDSWAEELGCDRKCFTRSWDKIGFRHKSRRAFEVAEDKFDGKMYASYYDRYTNQMFFVRNHDLANETLKEFYKAKKPTEKTNDTLTHKAADSLVSGALGTGHNVSSYKEAQKTPDELFNNNSHASNDIVKKMIELWTAIVQEGKGQIDVRGKIIPFLKKALSDKFDNCLQKWKEFCISIARSKFLMGEKTSFKVDLLWAIKFESIRKIIDGHYGIGDRIRKLTFEELEEQKTTHELEQRKVLEVVEEEINARPSEFQSIKDFRLKWLHTFGEKRYRQYLSNCKVEVGEDETTLIIRPQDRNLARDIVNDWNSDVLKDSSFKRVNVLHSQEFLGEPLKIDRWFGDAPVRGREYLPDNNFKNSDEVSNRALDGQNDKRISLETQQLRAELKDIIPPQQFPGWLADIEVQTIAPGGILVAVFEDQLVADYAKAKFCKEILQAANKLWQVDRVILQERILEREYQADLAQEPLDEETMIQQAIQSLIGMNVPKQGNWAVSLNDHIPF